MLSNTIKYQIKFWQHLATNSISNKDLYIFATGLQTPFTNLAILKNQNITNINPIIDRAYEFFIKYNNLPWGINIIENQYSQNIENALLDQGFKKILQEQGMKIEVTKFEMQNVQNINILEVIDPNMLNDWIIPVADAFEMGFDTDLYLGLIKKAFKKKSNLLKHFVLYENNKPVSSATISSFGKVARFDHVSTIKSSQNLGYGTKMVQYCIKKSHSYGAEHILFESTTKGLGLYKKLGFSEMRKSYIYSLYNQ